MVDPAHSEGLLAALAEKAPGAFDRAWDEYAPVAYALLTRILGSIPEADDAIESVWTIIERDSASHSGTRREEISWILSVARKHAVEIVRSKSSSDNLRSPDVQNATSGVVNEEGARETDRFDDLRAAVSSVLDQLPEEERHVLFLSYYEGLRLDEIAKRLELDDVIIRRRALSVSRKIREAFDNLPGANET